MHVPASAREYRTRARDAYWVCALASTHFNVHGLILHSIHKYWTSLCKKDPTQSNLTTFTSILSFTQLRSLKGKFYLLYHAGQRITYFYVQFSYSCIRFMHSLVLYDNHGDERGGGEYYSYAVTTRIRRIKLIP